MQQQGEDQQETFFWKNLSIESACIGSSERGNLPQVMWIVGVWGNWYNSV